jgi:hypothetical protein
MTPEWAGTRIDDHCESEQNNLHNSMLRFPMHRRITELLATADIDSTCSF